MLRWRLAAYAGLAGMYACGVHHRYLQDRWNMQENIWVALACGLILPALCLAVAAMVWGVLLPWPEVSEE